MFPHLPLHLFYIHPLLSVSPSSPPLPPLPFSIRTFSFRRPLFPFPFVFPPHLKLCHTFLFPVSTHCFVPSTTKHILIFFFLLYVTLLPLIPHLCLLPFFPFFVLLSCPTTTIPSQRFPSLFLACPLPLPPPQTSPVPSYLLFLPVSRFTFRIPGRCSLAGRCKIFRKEGWSVGGVV